jgi:hypothetical protein|eukprot:SAG25_NODE_798_length_5273_cov_3.375145_5_plen_50_part_00
MRRLWVVDEQSIHRPACNACGQHVQCVTPCRHEIDAGHYMYMHILFVEE